MVLSFFFASFCTFRCEWKANSFYSFASNRFEELSILCLFLIVKSPLMCTPGIYVHNFGSEITVNRRLHHQQGLIFEHLHVIDASNVNLNNTSFFCNVVYNKVNVSSQNLSRYVLCLSIFWRATGCYCDSILWV